MASCYPLKAVTAPEKAMTFVDRKGHPFQDLPVRQVWKNYSAESSSHEETRLTNSNGVVRFPERFAESPAIARFMQPVGNLLLTGVHASFGSSSYLIPLCDVMEAPTGTESALGNDSGTVILSYFDRSPIRAATGGTAIQGCTVIEAQAQNADA